MTEDQYQHLLSIIEDNSSKLDRIDAKLEEHDGQFRRIDAKLEEHDGHFLRIGAKLEEHDGHFRRMDEKLHEHDARFEILDEALGIVLRKVGDLDTRLDGFISLMKGSPLWRMMKVLES